MAEWIHDNFPWLFAVAAVFTFLAACWLALRTGRRGATGVIADILFPLLLAGLTLYFLPEIMSAYGIDTARYPLVLEGLFFRSLWLGLLLDQTSWVQRTTEGLRGRRATLPVLVWGLGFVILMIAPLADQGQNFMLDGLNKKLEDPDLREISASDASFLLGDWGLRVAQGGIAFTLVGAFALAMQAILWTVRIIHVYAFTQAVEADDQSRPPYAPGCFQWLYGFVFGVVGSLWLIWATFDLLQRGS